MRTNSIYGTAFGFLMLLSLASCGTVAQYSQQQRFQDDIYSLPYVAEEDVSYYTQEDFDNLAAARIANKKYSDPEKVYVVVDNTSDALDLLWAATALNWIGFYPYYHYRYDPWYWDPWYYRNHWYYHDHWYYHNPWYYNNPWYWDPWY